MQCQSIICRAIQEIRSVLGEFRVGGFVALVPGLDRCGVFACVGMVFGCFVVL